MIINKNYMGNIEYNIMYNLVPIGIKCLLYNIIIRYIILLLTVLGI